MSSDPQNIQVQAQLTTATTLQPNEGPKIINDDLKDEIKESVPESPDVQNSQEPNLNKGAQATVVNEPQIKTRRKSFLQNKLADLLNENINQRSETAPQNDSRTKTSNNTHQNLSATEKTMSKKSTVTRKALEAHAAGQTQKDSDSSVLQHQNSLKDLEEQKSNNFNQKQSVVASKRQAKASVKGKGKVKEPKDSDNEALDSDDPNAVNPADLSECLEFEGLETISEKQFQKEMQKIKARGMSAVPPKKPASAYIIFTQEQRLLIQKRTPNAKVTDIVKEMSSQWNKMNKEQTWVYREAAKKDKERYERELKLLESLAPGLEKPKKCLSAYMIFVHETRQKLVEANPDMETLYVMKEVGRVWQARTNEMSSYFQDKADRDKVRYLKEMKRYYNQIEDLGKKFGTQRDQDGAYRVNLERVNKSQTSSAQPSVQRQQQSTPVQTASRKDILPEPSNFSDQNQQLSSQQTPSALVSQKELTQHNKDLAKRVSEHQNDVYSNVQNSKQQELLMGMNRMGSNFSSAQRVIFESPHLLSQSHLQALNFAAGGLNPNQNDALKNVPYSLSHLQQPNQIHAQALQPLIPTSGQQNAPTLTKRSSMASGLGLNSVRHAGANSGSDSEKRQKLNADLPQSFASQLRSKLMTNPSNPKLLTEHQIEEAISLRWSQLNQDQKQIFLKSQQQTQNQQNNLQQQQPAIDQMIGQQVNSTTTQIILSPTSKPLAESALDLNQDFYATLQQKLQSSSSAINTPSSGMKPLSQRDQQQQQQLQQSNQLIYQQVNSASPWLLGDNKFQQAVGGIQGLLHSGPPSATQMASKIVSTNSNAPTNAAAGTVNVSNQFMNPVSNPVSMQLKLFQQQINQAQQVQQQQNQGQQQNNQQYQQLLNPSLAFLTQGSANQQQPANQPTQQSSQDKSNEQNQQSQLIQNPEQNQQNQLNQQQHQLSQQMQASLSNQAQANHQLNQLLNLQQMTNGSSGNNQGDQQQTLQNQQQQLFQFFLHQQQQQLQLQQAAQQQQLAQQPQNQQNLQALLSSHANLLAGNQVSNVNQQLVGQLNNQIGQSAGSNSGQQQQQQIEANQLNQQQQNGAGSTNQNNSTNSNLIGTGQQYASNATQQQLQQLLGQQAALAQSQQLALAQTQQAVIAGANARTANSSDTNAVSNANQAQTTNQNQQQNSQQPSSFLQNADDHSLDSQRPGFSNYGIMPSSQQFGTSGHQRQFLQQSPLFQPSIFHQLGTPIVQAQAMPQNPASIGAHAQGRNSNQIPFNGDFVQDSHQNHHGVSSGYKNHQLGGQTVQTFHNLAAQNMQGGYRLPQSSFLTNTKIQNRLSFDGGSGSFHTQNSGHNSVSASPQNGIAPGKMQNSSIPFSSFFGQGALMQSGSGVQPQGQQMNEQGDMRLTPIQKFQAFPQNSPMIRKP